MSDEPTQQEKLEALRNDTNFSWQQNAIDDPGGRFQKLDSDDRDWFSKLVAAAAPGKFALVESRPVRARAAARLQRRSDGPKVRRAKCPPNSSVQSQALLSSDQAGREI